MNTKELKNKTISGLVWRFGERILAQFISFIVSMILARLLLPKDYGVIAMVTIFITIADTLVTGGLGTSLVQKKNADDLDFSTMFHISVIFSILMYFILFMLAPIIASIYKNDLLIPVIRVMSLKIPLAAVNSIQQAYVQREMIYKKFFFATLGGTVISAVVGIFMAIKGFGVWALVAQYLTNSTIDTLVLFFSIKWKPKLMFSYKRFKSLFSFGRKMMLASLIGTIFEQLRGLIIGVKYSSTDLAFNNKGEQIPAIIEGNINSTVDSVLFSSISKVQDDKEKVKAMIRRLMKTSTFIITPMLFGIFGVSENFVKIVLTDKWLPCVPFMQIICIQKSLAILNTINLQAIKAIGRSDIILKLEYIKKPIFLVIIVGMMFISPLAMCIGYCFYGFVALLINSFPNKKLLNYNLKEQILDTFLYFIISFIMGLVVYFIGKINMNLFMLFVLQIAAGGFIYLALSMIFKLESYVYLLETAKGFIKKNQE